MFFLIPTGEMQNLASNYTAQGVLLVPIDCAENERNRFYLYRDRGVVLSPSRSQNVRNSCRPRGTVMQTETISDYRDFKNEVQYISLGLLEAY